MRAFTFLGLMLTLAGCNAATSDIDAAKIANPASENCVKLGGRVELRNEPGGTVGYCHLPDGRVVEEWALLRRGADNPDQKH